MPQPSAFGSMKVSSKYTPVILEQLGVTFSAPGGGLTMGQRYAFSLNVPLSDQAENVSSCYMTLAVIGCVSAAEIGWGAQPHTLLLGVKANTAAV